MSISKLPYEDTNYIRLGPYHVPHFNLMTSVKTLSQIWSHSELLEIRTSMYDWGEGREIQFSP